MTHHMALSRLTRTADDTTSAISSCFINQLFRLAVLRTDGGWVKDSWSNLCDYLIYELDYTAQPVIISR